MTTAATADIMIDTIRLLGDSFGGKIQCESWLAAKSKRGEGATTPPVAIRTEQYGKSKAVTSGGHRRL